MQKKICIFFITLCFVGISGILAFASEYKPQGYIRVDGDRIKDAKGVYVTSHYDLNYTGHSSIKNEAYYTVGSHYTFEGYTKLYSDDIYVNDTKQGTFNGNNGWHSEGEIYRNQSLPFTLKSGLNTFESRNVEGVGGDSSKDIYIDEFATAPTIVGTNSTWKTDEVSRGIRTWESLYTDGATGSKEGNKIQTSKGFMYYDKDEAPNGVGSYGHPDIPVSDNSRIDKITNQYGTIVDINALNKVGVYTVTSKTSDSGGLEATGTRVITVVENKYTVDYYGNGHTGGSTPSNICRTGENCTLTSNGFVRQYKVSYNPNGGSVSSSSAMAKASFKNWLDKRNNSVYGNHATVSSLSNVGSVTIPLYAQWTLGSVKLPTPIRPGYTFIGWYDNTSNKGKGGTSYTPPSDKTLIAKWDKNPTINASDKTFYQGEYTKTEWLNTIRMQGVSASDVEDGNITSKIKVIYDNVNVDVNGVYKVTYQVSDSVGATVTKDIKVTVKYNNPPVITGKDKTFYENEYSDKQWKDTIRWNDMNATDVEDGNLKSKVKITYDNTLVKVPGTYKVTYSVTDKFGKTATKDIKVTVKYNNPPTITGEDRWFYDNEDVTSTRLLERVKANDIEDGNITGNAVIKSSNVQNHVIGDYKVTYKITDRFGKSAETTANVHIVTDVPIGDDRIRNLRFISQPYANTLKANSTWRSGEKERLLSDSLNKTADAPAKEHWKLTSDDIKKIQEFNDTHGYSPESNALFYEEFSQLIQ